mmetsp:Transcript_56293/g.89386  ORF Transcript_56293/g.89386 Transcript_56293/m.89386 type:complete len:85 (-) Transcript_56293:390-644(-)
MVVLANNNLKRSDVLEQSSTLPAKAGRCKQTDHSAPGEPQKTFCTDLICLSTPIYPPFTSQCSKHAQRRWRVEKQYNVRSSPSF